jgi:starch-binding outer membrane protein, SusD/RagB family
MFIKKYSVAALLLLGSLLLNSCDKKLDISQTDAIDADKAFQTMADLQGGLYAVYASSSNGTRLYYGSILSDEVKLSDENRGQGQTEFRFQYSSGSGDLGGLGQYYQLIDRVHRTLDGFEKVPSASPADDASKKQWRAELLTLRGVAYLEMLTAFSPAGYDANALGVAVVLKSDLLAKPTRNTVGEVMAQIEADLAVGRAESTIPASPVADPLRLSQSAIAAYQARAALLKRDYDKAISFATEAITLSNKTLNRATFQTYWTDDASNESETIFKYRNGTAPQLNWRDANGDVFFEPSDKLKAQYNRVTDIRFSTYFGSAGADTSIVRKYPGSFRGPQLNDLKLIRLAEMYLIRAEANAEKDQLVAAATDLNALRAARITGYTNVTLASKAEAVTAILNERFKELCFEGFRFYDLKRKGLAVERLLSDSRNVNWQTLSANNFRFALPIPVGQIFANPNYQQNPGY